MRYHCYNYLIFITVFQLYRTQESKGICDPTVSLLWGLVYLLKIATQTSRLIVRDLY
ncbi:hypothetical protein VDIAB_110022 [Vibrio diabolicus]|nr:hypothetical protein VDIAB_110022 [Vibrio diabolicus]